MGTEWVGGYADKRQIAEEVLAANQLMDKQGWRSFDASYMAIEEIAKEIMSLQGLRPGSSV